MPKAPMSKRSTPKRGSSVVSVSPIAFEFEVFQSVCGPITVVESKRGLIRVYFGAPEEDVIARDVELAAGQPISLERGKHLRASDQIREYFAKKRKAFRVSLDLSGTTRFHRAVLEELARVGFGETLSYGQLAERVGKPGAARAVGGAMRKNPIPIVIPCHRVTASNGIGGFTGGLGIKRKLHELEGVS
jgi:O-6-methylguanine DNA methyltransferase